MQSVYQCYIKDTKYQRDNRSNKSKKDKQYDDQRKKDRTVNTRDKRKMTEVRSKLYQLNVSLYRTYANLDRQHVCIIIEQINLNKNGDYITLTSID
jgi:hypothetical protein